MTTTAVSFDAASQSDVLYVQKAPATLTEMSSHDIVTALQQTDIVLLPFGATEAHGAHLPLGTDSMEAREICRRTALRLAEVDCPVVIGPVMPFGTSSFHMGYPGTVSLKPATLIALIRDVCMSLYPRPRWQPAFDDGRRAKSG